MGWNETIGSGQTLEQGGLTFALCLSLLFLLGIGSPANAEYGFSPEPSREHSWGYIDKLGNFVIQPAFFFGQDFKEGMACVMDSYLAPGRMDPAHFIDKEGTVLETPVFEGVESYFSNGFAAVKLPERFERHFEIVKKWTYLGKDGKSHFGTFEFAGPFKDGSAVVKKDGLFGVIDERGNFTVSPQFTKANKEFGLSKLGVEIDKVWGYVDSQGKILVAPKFDRAQPFSNDRAVVVSSGISKTAAIDMAGKIVSSRYELMHDFSEGLAAVEVGRKWGYIDTTGKRVVPCRFDAVTEFTEGLAAVCTNSSVENRRIGFIDRNGQMVIEPKFVDAYSFSEGLAAVAVPDARDPNQWSYGFINKSGEWVIKPQFDEAHSFSEGLAGVCKVDRNRFPHPPQKPRLRVPFEDRGPWTYGPSE
jgi:hypothetical protein